MSAAESHRLFGRQRSLHEALGGGRVADVLLWRDRRVSASILIAITVIWFLFEVVEYNFVPLLCHISITTMLLVFIWYRVAEIFEWKLPEIEIGVDGSTVGELMCALPRKFNKLLDIACGNNPRLFLLTIVSLYILSVFGNYLSFVNLLFFGCLAMLTLPFLYERFEEDVDRLAGDVRREVENMYGKFEGTVLNRIPKGPHVKSN